MQTYRISKLNWQFEPDDNQLIRVEYRLTADPDEPASYTLVTSGIAVTPSGNFTSPVFIESLAPNTNYTIKYTNLGGGTPFTENITSTTPVEVGDYLDKVNNWMPNMQVENTSETGLLDSYLPEDVGFLYQLKGNLRDILDNFGNFQMGFTDEDLGAPWVKKDNEIGISITSNVTYAYPDPTDDSGTNQASIIGPDGKRIYNIGVWFYFSSAQLASSGVDGKLWIWYCGDGGHHIGLYIDTTTKYVCWTHVGNGNTETCVLDHAVVADKWHRVFVRRDGNNPSDSFSNQMLMKVDSSYYSPSSPTYFTSATDAAGNSAYQLYLGFGKQDSNGNLIRNEGIYKYFYFRGNTLSDNGIRERVINPPYPTVIVRNIDDTDEYTIPFYYFASLTNSKAAFVVPHDIPTGSKEWFFQTSSGPRTVRAVTIHPFVERTTTLDIDFSNPANFEANKEAVAESFGMLNKAWGGYANGGVVADNIYFQDGNLVLESHGDLYDGSLQGVNRDGTAKTHTITGDPIWGDDPLLGQPWINRVGGVMVSKEYFGFGRYLVRTKIPPLLGVAPAWWTFHYEEVYAETPDYELLLAEGLKREGNSSDGYYLVRNHEIDIEQPSHLAMGVMNGWLEVESNVIFYVLNDKYHIGIQNDTQSSSNNGLWKYVHTSIDASRTGTGYTIGTDGRTLTKTATNTQTARTVKAFNPSTGKRYFEVDIVSGTGVKYIGVGEPSFTPVQAVGIAGWSISSNSRTFDHQTGSGTTWGGGANTFAAGDTIGVLWDSDANTLQFFKNGTSLGTPFTNVNTAVEIMVCVNTSGDVVKVKPEKYDWKYPQAFTVKGWNEPNDRVNWTKVSDTIAPIYQPSFDNAKFNTWVGETGSGNGWRYKDGSIPDSQNDEVYIANLTPIGAMNDDDFHDYEWRWYKNRVEFWIDGVQVQISSAYIPDIPSRLTIGQWFPSGTSSNGTYAPWAPDPTKTWAGSNTGDGLASWNYQKFVIQRILFEPYDDTTAGGSNRLIGESYPYDGIKEFTIS